VIGPNGAGKTSLINCITGLYRPQAGSILLYRPEPLELGRCRPSQVARAGVARTFQNIELFKQLAVLDNLLLGRHVHMRHSVPASLLWFGPAQRQEIEQREIVEDVIDFLELQAVRSEPVNALPYGLQKRVELGRALCMHPSLLILDEPMAGMNVEEREDMARYLLDLGGLTILLVDHDMGVVMDLADHVTVLDFGRVVASGKPAEVRANPDVIRAYLGEEHAVA
jgi:branched-chain amino acid transport system ATP-binding protein